MFPALSRRSTHISVAPFNTPTSPVLFEVVLPPTYNPPSGAATNALAISLPLPPYAFFHTKFPVALSSTTTHMSSYACVAPTSPLLLEVVKPATAILPSVVVVIAYGRSSALPPMIFFHCIAPVALVFTTQKSPLPWFCPTSPVLDEMVKPVST